MPLGQSFAPLGTSDPTRQQNGRSGPISPVQESIQTLNLRLPRFIGPGAPAPQALLRAPGMAGMPTPESMESNPILAALARMITGGFMGTPTIPPSLMPGHLTAGVNPMSQSVTSSYAPSGSSYTPPKPRVVYQDNPDGQAGMGTPDAGADPYYGGDSGRTERQVYREANYYPETQSYF
jgi:hypothetical protein